MPACTVAGPEQSLVDQLHLEAIRRGMRLTVFRLARAPPASTCARLLADGLDLPLRPNEVRMFTALPARAMFRQAALGPDATCRTAADVITCVNGLSLPPGPAPPPGLALPTVAAPTLDISGPALDRLLSFGWTHDRDGLARSDGNWSTLLFRLAPPGGGHALAVDLRLRAAGADPDAVQPVMIRVASGAPLAATLSDRRTTQVTVRVPAVDTSDGTVRIALDIPNPAGSLLRSLASPARPVGVVLQSIDVRVAEPERAEPRD
jgi:hypothetical protein